MSNSRQVLVFFSSPLRPVPLCGPPSLLSLPIEDYEMSTTSVEAGNTWSRLTKPTRLHWIGHVAKTEETRNICRILTKKTHLR